MAPLVLYAFVAHRLSPVFPAVQALIVSLRADPLSAQTDRPWMLLVR